VSQAVLLWGQFAAHNLLVASKEITKQQQWLAGIAALMRVLRDKSLLTKRGGLRML